MAGTILFLTIWVACLVVADTQVSWPPCPMQPSPSFCGTGASGCQPVDVSCYKCSDPSTLATEARECSTHFTPGTNTDGSACSCATCSFRCYIGHENKSG